MAATYSGFESYAATGADVTKFNFLSTDTASGTDETTNTAAAPIAIPAASYSYSYERWIRAHWTSSFTTISTIKFWRAAGTLTGSIKIKALVKTPNPYTFVTPITTTSTYAGSNGNEGTATNDLAYAASTTAPGGALTPLMNTGTTGTPTTTNCSDYIIMQLVVPSGSASGTIGSHTFRFGWNEV